MAWTLASEEQRARRLLELPALLSLVATECATERGARVLSEFVPLADASALDDLWNWVEEVSAWLENGGDLPLAAMLDLPALLEPSERTQRGPLDGAELAGVGAAALALAQLRDAALAEHERLPRTFRHLDPAGDSRPLGDHLAACLEPDGRVRDSASPRLGGLRRAVITCERRVREVARSHMAKAADSGWTTAGELTLRGDHYCVPVRAGRRRDVPGVVHDRSATGATIYVEPLAVVEAGNQLQEARLEVAEEERRILIELNSQVAAQAEMLLDLFRRAVTVDGVRARARWGRKQGGLRPSLRSPQEGHLRLRGFRHPLLARALQAQGQLDSLVPLDLELQPADRTLLISGPNAGGKTVLLKAVGLATLMAHCGVPLPATEPPVLMRVQRVLMDLGDDQSIDDALSSFSAHVTHLRHILAGAEEGALVLLDEVGGGTDPEEGVALARAVLEWLATSGARTLATTHYGQLKALAGHVDGVRNASMAYDTQAMAPRFSLQLDIPGASHALEIAERIGLPAAVVTRARELVGDESLQLGRLLRDAESDREEAERQRDELDVALASARERQRQYEEMARQLKAKRKEHLDAAKREAEGLLRGARARIERTLQKVREGGEAAVEEAERARQEVDTAAEKVARSRGRERRAVREPLADPVVGQRVHHAALGRSGTVVDVRRDKVTLDVDGRRLVVAVSELARAEDEGAKPPRTGGARWEAPSASVSGTETVDVRGRDVADAWAEVDRALDRCLLMEADLLEVIHGKGTGRLRRGLLERLSRDRRARRVEPGGDEGVSFVHLGPVAAEDRPT